jgi:hypothetical protein
MFAEVAHGYDARPAWKTMTNRLTPIQSKEVTDEEIRIMSRKAYPHHVDDFSSNIHVESCRYAEGMRDMRDLLTK